MPFLELEMVNVFSGDGEVLVMHDRITIREQLAKECLRVDVKVLLSS